eukprot:06057.XXX_348980_349231_1 [CDS] Oithona nana genome sequencing.
MEMPDQGLEIGAFCDSFPFVVEGLVVQQLDPNVGLKRTPRVRKKCWKILLEHLGSPRHHPFSSHQFLPSHHLLPSSASNSVQK